MFKEQIEKYLYRRQYIFAPRIIQGLCNWKQIQVSKDYYLMAHPDLSVTIVQCATGSIYLLGYIIDPYNTSYSDSNILQDILDKSKTADEVISNVADKCGRFVIILTMGGEFRIFSDACGLRQVFYYFDNLNMVWCSSQPHIIAENNGIEVNENDKIDLLKTTLFKSTEHWFPGTLTLFKGIFHLTPNHYLDISYYKVIRYWPKKMLMPISVSECIQKVVPLLAGIIEAASHRFNLAFAISCGTDSRTLLAASRNVSKNIHYFTQCDRTHINTDPDVLIPSEMLKRLGLKHSVLVIPEALDEDFQDILQRNVFMARACKGLNAISIHNHFMKEKYEVVVLYGNCSEITKRDRFRFPKTPAGLINGSVLAAMALMSKSNNAIKEFSKWLEPVKKLTQLNIDILDLMHWEQRVGNWGAMSFSEYEVAYESLCPYSCRTYIEYMLRVPFKFRTRPDYKLHHEIIAAIWPELLEYEINPESNPIKRRIEDILYSTSIYDIIKLMYIMLYKRYS